LLEVENQQLKMRLQEIEERWKESVKTATDQHEKLQKYKLMKRLCIIRKDDIDSLKEELAQQKEQNAKMQGDFERLNRKYMLTREPCQIRTNKLNELRERFGVTVDSTPAENFYNQTLEE
jgi:hypothetical protein